MTGKTKKAGKSTTFDKCRQWLWSVINPTNPSDPPKPNPWLTNATGGTTAAITKSWLPTIPDASHQRPQLRHVVTNPFLSRASYEGAELILSDGSSITEALPNLSTNHGPPLLHLSSVLGPNAPTSGHTVHYTVHHRISPNSLSYKQISIRHEFTTADPFDSEKNSMKFTSAALCKGKLYATSLQGALAVMQVIDTRLMITAVGPTRAVPSSDSRSFRECLFEMNGEVLVVFLVHEKCVEVVDNVEVFRLDLERLCWIRVESLRGKTVVLKERCVWVESEAFGCRDDRVYFTEGVEKKWKVFDMKTCCISPVSPQWS